MVVAGGEAEITKPEADKQDDGLIDVLKRDSGESANAVDESADDATGAPPKGVSSAYTPGQPLRKDPKFTEITKGGDGDDSDDGERKAKIERVEVEMEDETAPPTTYQVLGEDLLIPPGATQIHFQCARIKKLENLEKHPELREIRLIANCVEKVENLEENINLVHLELYQNLIKKMENVGHLANLTTLDFSFNKIRKMQCLDNLRNLDRLYLSCNKIVEVQGLESLVNLKLLELGGNRIRSLGDISHMTKLEELWVGKNKIPSMALPPLPALRRVSFQNNRLDEWDETLFRNCPKITHLYLGHNKLPDFPEYFDLLQDLVELDMCQNALSLLRPMSLPCIKEFWLNYNNIASLEYVKHLSSIPTVETVYLEHNPIWKPPPEDTLYKKAILDAVPNLKQLDAYHLHDEMEVICKPAKVKGIRKR